MLSEASLDVEEEVAVSGDEGVDCSQDTVIDQESLIDDR